MINMRFIFSSFPFINLQITGVKKSIHTQINKPIDFLISLGHNPTICNSIHTYWTIIGNIYTLVLKDHLNM